MLFLNPTYQNPTGVTLRKEWKKKILEICSKFGIAIVEDDPYSLTGYGVKTEQTLKSMDKEGIVLYVSSLSKIISSGLRIGWIKQASISNRPINRCKTTNRFWSVNFPSMDC